MGYNNNNISNKQRLEPTTEKGHRGVPNPKSEMTWSQDVSTTPCSLYKPLPLIDLDRTDSLKFWMGWWWCSSSITDYLCVLSAGRIISNNNHQKDEGFIFRDVYNLYLTQAMHYIKHISFFNLLILL